MFGLFKRDPLKALTAEYERTLVAARDAQRSGNLALFGTLTEQSEKLAAEIDRLAAKR
ncbi:MAG: Lacal_2735 family protein [Cytophagaceae bacterium]|nr:Lacal_2735 family protein [Gemmatimonadaceae bacterium]